MNPPVLRLSPLLIALVGLAAGCRGLATESAGLSAPPARTSCETEARQLTESAALYRAPDAAMAPVATLNSGRFVYLCEKRGDWLGVMYPAVGEKVDCAERRTVQACALGWIRKDTHMAIFG